jgi:hypothetical protein
LDYQFVSYNTGTISSSTSATISLSNWDLNSYDYYLNFELLNVTYNHSIYLNFNQTTNPFNATQTYYPTSSDGTVGITNYSVTGALLSDDGTPRIMYSPNSGSFYISNCNITYKMSGLRQNVSTIQQHGEPVYTHGEGTFSGTTYYGGKGTTGTLGNWIGCDSRSIWGQINTLYVRYYLPDNNSNWGPTSIIIKSTDTSNSNTYYLTIYRMKRR